MKISPMLLLYGSVLLWASCSSKAEPKLAYAQMPKEVLIIGTMHTVHDDKKDIYDTLYQIARNYAPEAIFVEYPMPDDEKTWETTARYDLWKYLQLFKSESDSLREVYPFDENTLNRLIGKNYRNLTDREVDTIIASFTYLRDYANTQLYSYFKEADTERVVARPYQDENRNLSYPLAINLGLNKIYGIDDQQYAGEYALASRKTFPVGQTRDANTTDLMKRGEQIPRNVMNVNSLNCASIAHQLNSGRSVQPQTSASKQMIKYWDRRNENIARNFINYFNAQPAVKGVIIIGAGHIVGVKEEIEKQTDNIVVKLISDLP